MEARSKYGGRFCNPDEKQVTTIGSGYIANFLTGGVLSKAGATVTDMRIYFSGNVFSFNSKGSLSAIKEQKILNVRDVTGVGYRFYNPLKFIVWACLIAILGFFWIFLTVEENYGRRGEVTGTSVTGLGIGGFFIFLLLAGVFVALYLFFRKTLLCIEYAGGNIAFDVKWILSHEQDDFIRNIHLIKDKIHNPSGNANDYIVYRESAPSGNHILCQNCGHQNKPPSLFCVKCGNGLE
ncbi:MAG: zinc ribbon domain-containing protein [Defluviitaleaceae bacterium]|nr:zinc ribbon domain-containing protein [Defluviitaleaceae bacterium]